MHCSLPSSTNARWTFSGVVHLKSLFYYKSLLDFFVRTAPLVQGKIYLFLVCGWLAMTFCKRLVTRDRWLWWTMVMALRGSLDLFLLSYCEYDICGFQSPPYFFCISNMSLIKVWHSYQKNIHTGRMKRKTGVILYKAGLLSRKNKDLHYKCFFCFL